MTGTRLRSADERRAEARATAKVLCIDEGCISIVVETFSSRARARARARDRIGPIIERAMGDDWDHPLSTMKTFGAPVSLNAVRCLGKPVPDHRRHSDVQPWHSRATL